MRQAKFLIFLLIATLFSLAIPSLVLAETTELTTVADAFVNDAKPTENQGSSTLVISHDTAYRWGLVRFDLASLPGEAIIDSSILKLYLSDAAGPGDSVQIMVSRISGSWNESGTDGVTWNTRPSVEEGTSVSSFVDKTDGYKTWNVTDIVRDWVTGEQSNYGFSVGRDGDDFSRTFHSKEYWGNPPKLTITYHLPDNTPTPTLTLSPTSTPTPTSTPRPTATPTQSQLSSTPTEEVSPTPEESLIASEASEEQKGKVLQLTSGQLLIGATIILALIAAAAAFIAYSRRQPDKETKEEPEENEKDSDTKVGENE